MYMFKLFVTIIAAYLYKCNACETIQLFTVDLGTGLTTSSTFNVETVAGIIEIPENCSIVVLKDFDSKNLENILAVSSDNTVSLEFVYQSSSTTRPSIVASITTTAPTVTNAQTKKVHKWNLGGPTTGDYIALGTDYKVYFSKNFAPVTLDPTYAASLSLKDAEDMEQMLQSEIWDDAMKIDLSLTPSSNGILRLHFAEIYFTKQNKRVFDIDVAGQLVNDFDTFNACGGKNIGCFLDFPVTIASNGLITISFDASKNNAKLSGIEYFENVDGVPSTTVAPPNIIDNTPTTTLAPPNIIDDDLLINLVVRDSDTQQDFVEYLSVSDVSETSFLLVASNNTTNAANDTSTSSVSVDSIEIILDSSSSDTMEDIFVELKLNDTVQITTSSNETVLNLSTPIEISEILGIVQFTALKEGLYKLVLSFSNKNRGKLATLAKNYSVHEGHPYLHTVAAVSGSTSGLTGNILIDWEGSGFVAVELDGSGSHTHKPGSKLVKYNWFIGDKILCSTVTCSVALEIGSHDVLHEIIDDDGENLVETISISVVNRDKIPGLNKVEYLLSSGTAPSKSDISLMLIDIQASNNVVSSKAYRVDRGAFVLPSENQVVRLSGIFINNISNSTLNLEVAVDNDGNNNLPITCLLEFGSESFSGLKIIMFNAVVGDSYNFEVSCTRSSATTLEGGIKYPIRINGIDLDQNNVYHSELGIQATINNLSPLKYDNDGGTLVTISGYGLFNKTVFWDDVEIQDFNFNFNENIITFRSPASDSGSYFVQIKSKSNSKLNSFPIVIEVIDEGPRPINFEMTQKVKIESPAVTLHDPIHNWFITGTVSGDLCYFKTSVDMKELDGNAVVKCSSILKDKYLIETEQSNQYSNFAILGLAINPFESNTGKDTVVYVSWGTIFANGGACVNSFAPYPGGISKMTLDGTTLQWSEYLVSNGLPVSNHDHSINAIVFDENGDLIVAIGGNTNAGVPGDCSLGALPESPLSGALVRLQLSLGDAFNGEISYVNEDGSINMDARDGENVYLKDGVNVEVYSPGHRNPFGCVFSTFKYIFCTDNGPNKSFGKMSYGLNKDSDGDAPTRDDELNLIVPYVREGTSYYYGHPNRSHGRCKSSCPNCNDNDESQCIYKDLEEKSSGSFVQSLAKMPRAQVGIDEYRSNAFNGALRYNLLLQDYKGSMARVKLSDDGTKFTFSNSINGIQKGGLNVYSSVGGSIISTNLGLDSILVFLPKEEDNDAIYLYDVMPWRGPAGNAFVIGGRNFQSIQNLQVFFGSSEAQVSSVETNIIRGIIPTTTATTISSKETFIDIHIAGLGIYKTLKQGFYHTPTNY